MHLQIESHKALMNGKKVLRSLCCVGEGLALSSQNIYCWGIFCLVFGLLFCFAFLLLVGWIVGWDFGGFMFDCCFFFVTQDFTVHIPYENKSLKNHTYKLQNIET